MLPIWRVLQRERTVPTFNLAWEDMSNFVVHFTRQGPQPKTPYDNIMSMLSSGRIEARNPFGMAHNAVPAAPNPDSQKTVCFSEIPLHQLSRLTARRGPYGVGFTKKFMVARGGGPSSMLIWGRHRRGRSRISWKRQGHGPPPLEAQSGGWRPSWISPV